MRAAHVQLLVTTESGDIVECGEDSGVTRGIAAAPAADGDDEDGGGDDADEARAAAADDAGHPRPRGQDTDPHGFAQRESWTIDVAALPARARVAVLAVTNFAGGGMGNVRRLQARVVDAGAPDAAEMRDVATFSLPNVRGAHANRSVAVLARVHREPAGALGGPVACCGAVVCRARAR